MNDARFLILGNPRIGTPAMQDGGLTGLFLLRRVLLSEDGEGRVWLYLTVA
jgi:uncharacterized protein (DUF302 family)